MLSWDFSLSYLLCLYLSSASFMSNTNFMSSGMYFWTLQYSFLSDAATEHFSYVEPNKIV